MLRERADALPREEVLGRYSVVAGPDDIVETYRELITEHLPQHEYLGEEVRNKLVYYPTVTREKFDNNGRLTDLLRIGKLAADVGLEPIDPEHDRFMICGSPSMLKEICGLLDSRGFREARQGEAAHYVIERAFVES